jgi:hypothetical protein
VDAHQKQCGGTAVYDILFIFEAFEESFVAFGHKPADRAVHYLQKHFAGLFAEQLHFFAGDKGEFEPVVVASGRSVIEQIGELFERCFVDGDVRVFAYRTAALYQVGQLLKRWELFSDFIHIVCGNAIVYNRSLRTDGKAVLTLQTGADVAHFRKTIFSGSYDTGSAIFDAELALDAFVEVKGYHFIFP